MNYQGTKLGNGWMLMLHNSVEELHNSHICCVLNFDLINWTVVIRFTVIGNRLSVSGDRSISSDT